MASIQIKTDETHVKWSVRTSMSFVFWSYRLLHTILPNQGNCCHLSMGYNDVLNTNFKTIAIKMMFVYSTVLFKEAEKRSLFPKFGSQKSALLWLKSHNFSET